MISVNSRKRYTLEFKTQAVGLVRLGKPVTEVAEELGIGSGLLYKWLRLEQQLNSNAQGESSEAQQISKLRREIARLRDENVILKKAAIILGVKPLAANGL